MSLPLFQPLRYVYQPAAPGATHTLLLLHGTGGDEWDLLPLAAELGRGMNVLSLRGNVLEGAMPRFFRRLGMGWFDEEDVAFRTHELVHFLHELSDQEGFDVRQLVIVGYSNGANMAGSILLLYPNLVAAAVLWRPMQALSRNVPAAFSSRSQPVLFGAGLRDLTVTAAASAAYVKLLRAVGYRVTRSSVDAGHNLSHLDIEQATHWLQQQFRTGSLPTEPTATARLRPQST